MIRRRTYAVAALCLLLVEAAIALWVHDALVRPYVGDNLAVVLVYCAIRAATPLAAPVSALLAFMVAVIVELSQSIHLVDRLGWSGSPIARAILGTGFDPRDFLAYAAGAALALAIEGMTRLSHR